MKTKFMMSSTTVDVVKFNEETALDLLPAGIYTVRFHDLRGYYLDITKDELEIPSRIYGNTPSRVDKCVKTYVAREGSTGILMTGDKGTGKSLFMALIANRVIKELNMPVVMIKHGFSGEAFNVFIEQIGECCLIFDEFGKMYDSGSSYHRNTENASQHTLLSLMDGVDKTKRLIILTENKELDISEFMLNRPSRLYYHFRYHKIDESSITDYCDDRGVSAGITEELIELSRRTILFSFDMMQAIVEEHLRFNESIAEAIADLNIELREDAMSQFEVIKVVDSVTDTECQMVGPSIIDLVDNRYYIVDISTNKGKSAVGPVPEPDNEYGASGVGEPQCEADDGNTVLYLEENNIMYQRENTVVYKSGNYVITGTKLARKTVNYSYLF